MSAVHSRNLGPNWESKLSPSRQSSSSDCTLQLDRGHRQHDHMQTLISTPGSSSAHKISVAALKKPKKPLEFGLVLPSVIWDMYEAREEAKIMGAFSISGAVNKVLGVHATSGRKRKSNEHIPVAATSSSSESSSNSLYVSDSAKAPTPKRIKHVTPLDVVKIDSDDEKNQPQARALDKTSESLRSSKTTLAAPVAPPKVACTAPAVFQPQATAAPSSFKSSLARPAVPLSLTARITAQPQSTFVPLDVNTVRQGLLQGGTAQASNIDGKS
ncbi:hypothetical protein CPC08DRAFT_771827 [Agrocybe pediades]|nr:hypothetical protein CPC08DRAFT_771827 [Agrocybe pediades]